MRRWDYVCSLIGRVRHPCVALSVLTLAACGGGSGSSNGGLIVEDVLDERPLADSDTEDEGLPDFAITDLVTPASNDAGSPFGITVTIANGGTAAGNVSMGWFLISEDPDFTTNYFHVPIRFAPQAPNDGLELAPGESREFVAITPLLGNATTFHLSRLGEHHARVWINPDLSQRFKNPEPDVVESHEVQELDYENNLSPMSSFEETAYIGDPCIPDVYEDNDSLDTATPIALDTIYDMNDCDDLTEVTVVDMVAGESYELHDHTGKTLWDFAVVTPDGRYLTRNAAPGTIVTAEDTGSHHVIATYADWWLGRNVLSLEVISR